MTNQQVKRPHSKRIYLWGGLAIAVSIFIIAPIASLIYISDNYALVEKAARIDARNAAKAKDVAKQIYTDLMDGSPTQRREITLSENEINGIFALAARGIPGSKGRVNVTPLGIKAAFTFYAPKNPFGDFINLTATIDPSSTGLVINNITIGSLEISGEPVVSLAESLLNRLLGKGEFGSKLIGAIESVHVQNSVLHVAYHPIAGLRQAIENSRGEVKKIRDELALLGNPKLVRPYYQKLCSLQKQIGGMGDVPLGYYLSDTFSFAKKRTAAGGKAEEENRAALLALAIFVGSYNFNSVIGAVDTQGFQRCPTLDNQVVLAKREDLRLHFIFSAALKIISDSGLSFAIGEFKELLDSQQGGSGFSYVDLAADRAGIRFAELAIHKSGALRLQQMASQLTEEAVFFPAIDALKEGISQQDFENSGGIDGDNYKANLATIISRIENLPLYRSN